MMGSDFSSVPQGEAPARLWHGNVFYQENPLMPGMVRRAVYEAKILPLLLRDDLLSIEWRCNQLHDSREGWFVAKKNVHREHFWKLYFRNDKAATQVGRVWTNEFFEKNIYTKDLLLLHWRSMIPSNPVLGVLREPSVVEAVVEVDERFNF